MGLTTQLRGMASTLRMHTATRIAKIKESPACSLPQNQSDFPEPELITRKTVKRQ